MLFFLISEFPKKLLINFTKTSSVIMKLMRTWYNTMEIIRVTAIVKLNSCIKENLFEQLKYFFQWFPGHIKT